VIVQLAQDGGMFRYWDLHKPGPPRTVERARLRFVVFSVNHALRLASRQQGQTSVHAWAVGELVEPFATESWVTPFNETGAAVDGWLRFRYRKPYGGEFYLTDTGAPILGGEEALFLTGYGAFLRVPIFDKTTQLDRIAKELKC
jgi:hypothetical protein